MRCPTLKELPPPPAGKSGWPWTEESPQLPDAMPDGSPWPRISIVTPSFNQGQFLEETIRSVLLQGYPDLEYTIIDGGSTDASTEILKKYEPWLTYWVSEPDRGQSHAINKGVSRSTGGIVAWLNSDDTYLPNCLLAVAKMLASNSRVKEAILYGDCEVVDGSGAFLYKAPLEKFNRNKLIQYWREYFIPQPSVFIPGHIFRTNLLNESLHYVMDWELWLRLSLRYDFVHLPAALSKFKSHQDSKWGKSREKFLEEQKQIYHLHHKNRFFELYFHLCHLGWHIRKFYHMSVRRAFVTGLHCLLGDRLFKKLRDGKRTRLPSLSKMR